MTFHTGPGEEPVTFGFGDLTVTKMSVGDMDNNTYLIQHYLGDSVIIDAAAEAPRITELAGGTKVRAIITTHEHHDHIGALKTVANVFSDAEILATPETGKELPVKADKLKDGKTLSFGNLELEVIVLRGHTPAGAAIVASSGGETHIFTGDSLFPGGVGKTPSDQAFFLLFNDVRDKIFAQYDDATVIHPGHGDSTTVGAERSKLPSWEERGW